MKKYQKYLPYALFFIITIFMFSAFLFSANAVLFSSDQLESGIFFRKFYAEFVRTYGQMPLWNRFISSGLPFVDAMHGDTFYPAAVIQFFMPMHKALGLKLVLHVFLSGAFMYVFLKNYGLRKTVSLAGAVAYMTAPMIVSLVYPGHDAKMYVAALLPLGFNFLHKALEGKGFTNYLYFGAVTGFMILSSHIQTTYFSLWAYFFFALYRVVYKYLKAKDLSSALRSSAFFWTGIAFGLMIGLVQLLPPYIYAKNFSIRGTDAKTSFEHAITWGIHPEEAVSLIVPEFCGENRLSHVQTGEEYEKVIKQGGNSYWGRNPFKLNSEYSGVIILFFTVLSLFFYKGRFKKDVIFFSSFGLFTLLYSLVDHTPLFRLAYTVIPGVKLFRGQGMILFILTFVLAVCASVLLDHFISLREENRENKVLIKRLSIITGVVFACGLVLSFGLNGFLGLYESLVGPPKMPDPEYIPHIRNGIIISSLLVSAAILSVLWFLKKAYGVREFIIIITVLFFADSYRINKKFIQTADKDLLGIKFTDVDLTRQLRELEQQEGYFRIFDINMFGSNQLPIHSISTVRGFHDNELKWYRKFRGVNEEGVNTDRNFFDDINNYTENNFFNLSGARFLLYQPEGERGEILPNPNFMPRAYLVSDYEIIKDEDDIVLRLKSDFDIRSKVILEKEPVLAFSPESVPGKVISYRYEGNNVILEADMSGNGIIVMTDNYFPYWSAYDQDGKEIEIYKANLTFRAIELPAGKHKIVFKFVSLPYNIGKYSSIAGIMILLGLFLKKFFRGKQ